MTAINKNSWSTEKNYCIVLTDPWSRRQTTVKVGDIPYIRQNNNGPREDLIDYMRKSKRKERSFSTIPGALVFIRAAFLDELVDDISRKDDENFIPKVSIVSIKTKEQIPINYNIWLKDEST